MKENEGLVPNWVEDVLREIQGVLAISYVLLIIIGMINETVYFGMFGINIFEYSQVFDFMIAPFKQVEYLIFLAITFGITLLTYYVDIKVSQAFPKFYNWSSFGMGKEKWYGAFRVISVLFVFFGLLFAYASFIGENKKQAVYEATIFDTEIVLGETERMIQGNKIGANSNYLFLLDEQRQIQVIPIHSTVLQITVK